MRVGEREGGEEGEEGVVEACFAINEGALDVENDDFKLLAIVIVNEM